MRHDPGAGETAALAQCARQRTGEGAEVEQAALHYTGRWRPATACLRQRVSREIGGEAHHAADDGAQRHACRCVLHQREPAVAVDPNSVGRNLIGTGGDDCAALGDPDTDPLIGDEISALPAGAAAVPATGIVSSVTQVAALQAGSLAIDAYPADAALPAGVKAIPLE